MIVKIAIFGKDEEAFGAGIELSWDGDTYAILSLYLPKTEYPTKRSILPLVICEAFKVVPKAEQEVIFLSTLPHFQKSKELKLKAGIYSPIKTKFRCIEKSPWQAKALAIDAVKPGRRSTIIEIL